MKKQAVLFFGIFLGIFMIDFVSAQSDLTSYWIERTIQGAQDFFSPFFEALLNASRFDEYFFVKILLLFLLFFVIRLALSNVPVLKAQKGPRLIISAIVALIGTRYLSELDIIQGVLIPYGTLAVALSTLIPFIIYFYFVHRTIPSPTGRKVAWIFYIVILVGIWVNRYQQLDRASNWILFSFIALALLLFFFDKRVRRYFAMHEIRKSEQEIKDELIVKAQKGFIDNYKVYLETGSESDWRRAKHYRERLREMGVKDLPAV